MGRSPNLSIEIPNSQSPSTSREPSPASGRTKPLKSNLHQHTRERKEYEPTHDGKQIIFYCKYCPKALTIHTNFKKHLKGHGYDVDGSGTPTSTSNSALDNNLCKELIDTVLEKIGIIIAKGGQEQLRERLTKYFVDDKVLEEKLVKLIVVESLPFSMVEWKTFQELCHLILLPDLPSRRTITRRIHDLYTVKKAIVRQQLGNAVGKVQLSVDIWTTPNRLLFLGVIAHFVDPKKKELKKGVIQMARVSGHAGEDQFSVLKPTIQEYGLIEKLGALTSDNSTTNDTLCKAIELFLGHSNYTEKSWDAAEQRIRCIGHIFNLVVKAFLFKGYIDDSQLQSYDDTQHRMATDEEIQKRQKGFRKLGPLGKLHNISVHIRASPQRTQDFKDLANKMLPLDNATRWNSWYTMLKVALAKERDIDTYVKDNWESLSADCLTKTDWDALRAMTELLEYFKEATVFAQGDRGLLHETLINLDILNKVLARNLLDSSKKPDFLKRVQNAHSVLCTYRDKLLLESRLYMAAVALHPKYRTKYFISNWNKDDQKKYSWKSRLQALYKEYEKRVTPQRSRPPAAPNERKPFKGSTKYLAIRQELVPHNRRHDNEWDDFQHESPCNVEGSPITWWLQKPQLQRWPTLSTMAIDILSISAMSDDVESMFSGGRRTISWDRMSLSENSIQATECLKSWFRDLEIDTEIGVDGDDGGKTDAGVDINAEITGISIEESSVSIEESSVSIEESSVSIEESSISIEESSEE